MQFDPSQFAQQFWRTYVAGTDEAEILRAQQEKIDSLMKTFKSVLYGYFQLMYKIAQKEAFKKALHDGTIRYGGVQAYKDAAGYYKPWKGELGVRVEYLPYSYPGTERAIEFNNDALACGIRLPLYEELYPMFKANVIDQLLGMAGRLMTQGLNGEGQIQQLIDEVLQNAVDRFGEYEDKNQLFIGRVLTEDENWYRMDDEEKRWVMRRLLVYLNEEAMTRRKLRNRDKGRAEQTPIAHADTQIGRGRIAPPVRRSQQPVPQVQMPGQAQIPMPQAVQSPISQVVPPIPGAVGATVPQVRLPQSPQVNLPQVKVSRVVVPQVAVAHVPVSYQPEAMPQSPQIRGAREFRNLSPADLEAMASQMLGEGNSGEEALSLVSLEQLLDQQEELDLVY